MYVHQIARKDCGGKHGITYGKQNVKSHFLGGIPTNQNHDHSFKSTTFDDDLPRDSIFSSIVTKILERFLHETFSISMQFFRNMFEKTRSEPLEFTIFSHEINFWEGDRELEIVMWTGAKFNLHWLSANNGRFGLCYPDFCPNRWPKNTSAMKLPL